MQADWNRLDGARTSASLSRLIALLAVLTFVSVTGCGDETTDGDAGSATPADTGNGGDIDNLGDTTGGEDTAVEVDTGPGEEDIAAEDTADVAPDVDVGEPDIAEPDVCPGGPYCSCSKAADCTSTFCMDSPGGKYCAPSCIDGCDKDGFTCLTVNGIGPDGTATICVPKGGAKLCSPCKENADCKAAGYGAASCVKYGGGDLGAFCGIGCDTSDQCPVDYECKEVEDVTGKKSNQCVMASGKGICKCSTWAIEQELSTDCFKTAGETKCPGTRTCLAAGKQGAPDGGGLSSCDAADKSSEICDGTDNDCDGDIDETACDDDNPCTGDECSKGTFQCEHTNKTGLCDADETVCTKDDSCVDGKCKAGELLECDDKNPCTDDKCDKEKGCEYTNNKAPCNADDNLCTVNDSCSEGKCNAGDKKACASDDPCVKGSCKISDGKCKYGFQTDEPCDDGKICFVKDKCISENDGCKGTALNCDDGSVCTADECDATKGCTGTPQAGKCDDGDLCTKEDKCAGGKCAGGGALDCDDKDVCTKDSCDSKAACKHAPLTNTMCDDGNDCTTGDTCQKGKCTAGNNQCVCVSNDECKPKEDGNLCNGTLFCDKSKQPWNCKVDPKTVKSCDTSKDTFCAETKCDPADGACKIVKKSKGTPCDADKSVCTKGDFCGADGVCTPGDKLACDDSNTCSDDSCDPVTGCKSVFNTAPCDADGNACTVNDKCTSGKCAAGPAKKCDDSEACTKNTCDKKNGACLTQNLPGACDDNNVCTKSDQCGKNPKTGKYTCIGGAADKCNDNNLCTKDICVAGKGCVNTNDDSLFEACYTADPKTKGVGICKAGKKLCKAGKLGAACTGEIKPQAKENCYDKLDNNCNKTVNEGCAPTGYTARFGTAVLNAKGQKYGAHMLVGGSTAAGQSKGSKHTVDFGFYAWLKGLLGK